MSSNLTKSAIQVDFAHDSSVFSASLHAACLRAAYRSEHIFDIAQAQSEAEVEPHRVSITAAGTGLTFPLAAQGPSTDDSTYPLMR